MPSSNQQRKEFDSMGFVSLSADSYHGISTHRYAEKFFLSGQHIEELFIRSMAQAKKSALIVNEQSGLLDSGKSKAILKSCDEIIDGKFNESFILNPFSTPEAFNTNMNEVIANRAIEIKKKNKGDYSIVSPNNDVNLNQSSLFMFQAAAKLTSLHILPSLLSNLSSLEKKLSKFSDENLLLCFHSIQRTSSMVKKAAEEMKKISFSSIGNANHDSASHSSHPVFRENFVKQLRKETRVNLRLTPESNFQKLSSVLMLLAADVISTAKHLKLKTKYDKEAAEACMMSCYHVIGNHQTVVHATEQSSSSIAESLVYRNVLHSLETMENAVKVMNTLF